MAPSLCNVKELHEGQRCDQRDPRAGLLTTAERRGTFVPLVEISAGEAQGCSPAALDHGP